MMASVRSTMLSLLSLLLLAVNVQSLHFYLDNTSPKCFYEELPKDTLVVGHFKSEQYEPASNRYVSNPDLRILITVSEVFDNNHVVVRQTASGSGKFTFTSADAGDHKICFQPNHASTIHGNHFIGGERVGNVKMSLDIAVGETNQVEATDKEALGSLLGKVREMKAKLDDIKKEQVFQREREAEFRDQSEATNSKIVRWSLVQLFLLIGTCVWQLSHLRSFFIKQKLS